MYRAVGSTTKICEIQYRMYEQFIERQHTNSVRCDVNVPPSGYQDAEVFWAEDVGIWLFPRVSRSIDATRFRRYCEQKTGEDRFWNAFGTQDPRDNRVVAITVEINPGISGSRRPAGIFYEDDESRGVWVGHRGRLGRKKLEDFWNEYTGESVMVHDSDGSNPLEYAAVAKLGEASFVADLADFVREVRRIKAVLSQT